MPGLRAWVTWGRRPVWAGLCVFIGFPRVCRKPDDGTRGAVGKGFGHES